MKELELMPEHEKNGSCPNQNQTTTDYDAAATSITTSLSPSLSAGRYQENYNGPNHTLYYSLPCDMIAPRD